MKKSSAVLEEIERLVRKKPKKYLCFLCRRKYCFLNGAAKHNILKHNAKARFYRWLI